MAQRRSAAVAFGYVAGLSPETKANRRRAAARWVAFDEVYGRSEELRKKTARAGLAYVAIIPCDYPVPLPSGAVIRADEAVADAVFERRSCGNGSKGPRYSDWAMTATGIKGQYLLIRRLISRPDQLTFCLCWAPPGRPATMTCFITIAGRRWPVEETFKTGKDVLGWDQAQARSWNGICRHTALAALAQLRAAAIRNALTGRIQLPGTGYDTSDTVDDGDISDADLLIPLGDAPVPVRGGQPCPPGIAHQAADRRDRPARRPRQAIRRRADLPRPPRLRAALVRPAAAPPGHRPLAPLQRPARRHNQHRVTSRGREGGDAM